MTNSAKPLVPDRLLRRLALHLFHSPTFPSPYDQPTAATILGCTCESLSRALAALRGNGPSEFPLAQIRSD